ncbi:hypothetical protein GCM10018963_50150 [Saccharothrix longispora]
MKVGSDSPGMRGEVLVHASREAVGRSGRLGGVRPPVRRDPADVRAERLRPGGPPRGAWAGRLSGAAEPRRSPSAGPRWKASAQAGGRNPGERTVHPIPTRGWASPGARTGLGF